MGDGTAKTPDSSSRALQKSGFAAFSGCTTGGTPLKIVCIAIFAMHRKFFVVTFGSPVCAVNIAFLPVFANGKTLFREMRLQKKASRSILQAVIFGETGGKSC